MGTEVSVTHSLREALKVIDYRWLKDQHLKAKTALGQQVVDAIAFQMRQTVLEFNPMLSYVDLVYTFNAMFLMVSQPATSGCIFK